MRPRTDVTIAAVLAVVVAGAAACSRSDEVDPEATELVVFAAASLRDVMNDVAAAYKAVAPSVTVWFNFAGSNVLARQILAAPKADVFLSANEQWMDVVQAGGQLEAKTRRVLLSNRLVVVVHASAKSGPKNPHELATAGYRYLSLADPEAVPAGRYARQFLERAKVGDSSVWDAVKALVAPSPDARAALALVESDPRIVGILYRTDAAVSRRVKIAFEVSPELSPEIRYVAAVTTHGATRGRAGQAFLDFLSGPQATTIATRHGFGLPARRTPTDE